MASPFQKLLSASIPLTDNLSYPVYRLFMSAVCMALALGLYWLISKTRLGMKIRAGAFNRDMTEALGINIKLIHAVVFALGCGLGGCGGHDCSTHLQRVSQHGLASADHVLCGGGYWRHWLGAGALISALLVGLVDTFGKVLLPQCPACWFIC